jgi:cytochrome P450 family 6
VKKAKRVFELSPLSLLKFHIAMNVPLADRIIKVTMTAPDVGEYFGSLLKEGIRQRTERKLQRNDFINLLLQLREEGSVKLESKDPQDDFLKIESSGDTETLGNNWSPLFFFQVRRKYILFIF